MQNSRELVELLNSYQNNNNNHDHDYHDRSDNDVYDSKHTRYHKYSEEQLNNSHVDEQSTVDQFNDNLKVSFKNMKLLDINVKQCDYMEYNGYKYRRELLNDNTVNWEIERATSDESNFRLRIFYQIFNDLQIQILERKYHEIKNML